VELTTKSIQKGYRDIKSNGWAEFAEKGEDFYSPFSFFLPGWFEQAAEQKN
jgi:hypothetical protein